MLRGPYTKFKLSSRFFKLSSQLRTGSKNSNFQAKIQTFKPKLGTSPICTKHLFMTQKASGYMKKCCCGLRKTDKWMESDSQWSIENSNFQANLRKAKIWTVPRKIQTIKPFPHPCPNFFLRSNQSSYLSEAMLFNDPNLS